MSIDFAKLEIPEDFDAPLELVTEEFGKKLAEEFDNRCYAAITKTTGIVIDKDKMAAALMNDKKRYKEAYKKGYQDALKDVLKSIEIVREGRAEA